MHCLYALQASGTSPNSIPRRSARFANQQKNPAGAQQTDHGSSRSNQQPPGSTAQAQQSRSWLQTVTWIAWAVLGLLAAVLAATNPSRAAFVESIQQLTSKGLGQWAGQHLHCFMNDLNAAKYRDAASDCDPVADCVIHMILTKMSFDKTCT